MRERILSVAVLCVLMAAAGSDSRKVQAGDGLVAARPGWQIIARGNIKWDEIYMLFRRGDANSDGVVDLSDAISITNWLYDPAVPDFDCMNQADANADGSIDSSDAIYLINWYSNGQAPPPAPGPYATECSDDQRDSALGCITHSC